MMSNSRTLPSLLLEEGSARSMGPICDANIEHHRIQYRSHRKNDRFRGIGLPPEQGRYQPTNGTLLVEEKKRNNDNRFLPPWLLARSFAWMVRKVVEKIQEESILQTVQSTAFLTVQWFCLSRPSAPPSLYFGLGSWISSIVLAPTLSIRLQNRGIQNATGLNPGINDSKSPNGQNDR